MWRFTFTIFRKVPLIPEKNISKVLYSTRRDTKKRIKIGLISTCIGTLVGVGSYTYYKKNSNSISGSLENKKFSFLNEAPKIKAHYKVVNNLDTSKLQLVLFQYHTCPSCSKVRSYLNARGISYDVVEVDAVLRQDIRWSEYGEVPILLAKVNDGHLALVDSTAIISILETYLKNKTYDLLDVVKLYPISNYANESGRVIENKYNVMVHTGDLDKEKLATQAEEQKWRRWADNVLFHTLSPNVYRTPGEALETFKWFEEVGGWSQFFPQWECTMMVYVGAAAMWVISKILKARHGLHDDVRQDLYSAANYWMKTIKTKKTPFLGGNEPNLADISVYGILSSIEGCQAFIDLKKNSKIGSWFEDMKTSMAKNQGKVYDLVQV